MPDDRPGAARLRAALFVIASVVSAVLVLSAPFVGWIRGQIRAAFPGRFVAIVGGMVALAIGGALVAAIVRIRERRALRYGLLALSLAGGIAYSYLTRTGNPEADAVEHFHFVSYGLVTLLFYRAWRPLGDGALFVLPVLSALIVGTLDEWFQWFIPNRIGELRDIFLNAAAIATGLLFSLGLDPPERFTVSMGPASRVRIRRVFAATVVVLAAFVSVVHMGHLVRDAGRAFKSIYSAEQLDALTIDRAARWRTDPPVLLKRVSAEDQYMSEGVWHVHRRNRAWQAGDAATAFEENLILERFFGPVLDSPSYVSRTGHRWSAAHRADAEARAGQAAQRDYFSDANLYPIFAWPRAAFWLCIAAIVLLAVNPFRRVTSRRASRTANHPSAG